MVSYMSYDVDAMLDPAAGARPDCAEAMELADAMRESMQQ